jgi:hypothetical protein
LHPLHIYQHYDNDQFIDREWFRINSFNLLKLLIVEVLQKIKK